MGVRAASATERGADGTSAEHAPSSNETAIDALWLATLQAIGNRAAHDLRGALNAVSVNLEVARSRSEKPGVPASALAQYTSIASTQLEGVITATEALMVLVRSGHGPVDIGAEIGRVVALLAPAARTAGRTIELDRTFGGLGTTSARTSSARLVIGHCLVAAADASVAVRCVADDSEATHPRLRIEHDGATVSLDAGVLDVLAATGIEVRTEPRAIVITFPR
jgi:signal transduction histidine kinase